MIDGDSIVVSSPSVPKPVAVRYAWDANPEACLHNGAGLPAVP
jgi:sialate O-acetylesterase